MPARLERLETFFSSRNVGIGGIVAIGGGIMTATEFLCGQGSLVLSGLALHNDVCLSLDDVLGSL